MEETVNSTNVNQIEQLNVSEVREKEEHNYNITKIRSGRILENGILGNEERNTKEETRKIWRSCEENRNRKD